METRASSVEEKIKSLQGPILVLGGSGFIGANLVHTIVRHRRDVVGVASRLPSWRLDDLDPKNVRAIDLLINSNLDRLLDEFRPRTVFNCAAYGAYSFQTEADLIYETNFNFVSRLLARLAKQEIACYVHAGSSSEYGDNAAGTSETAPSVCNSDYSVSKVAASNLIQYFGKRKGFPCANLRLYSIFGPMEDPARLVPTLVRCGTEGRLPEFVHPDVSHDFVYVEDACEAFFDAALNLTKGHYGESFNIGSGRNITIGEIAGLAKDVFGVDAAPVFTMPNRSWDLHAWYADTQKTREALAWQARTDFRKGLLQTVAWYKALGDKDRYLRCSKKHGLDAKHGVSAIVACYKDGQAIPIMYERLKATFEKLQIEHEIIFVNDCSPDDSEDVIRKISMDDRRVIGITHSRNFGSQAAFRSGMEIFRKNACVLLDGDLQDPPEMIEKFVQGWREGYDVVYGRRVKREATLFMQVAYKLFYRLFDTFSYLKIPHDAGDFSLLDRSVVNAMLRFPERDLFLRGVRAFAGFKQLGVDYHRPARMFGETTNSLIKNLGWAKKGILAFSNVPLNVLTACGFLMLSLSLLLGAGQFAGRLLFPTYVPSGITTVLLCILFFGAINFFGIALLGEYIAKIFEEVKQRPLFIRRSIIRNGEVRPASELSDLRE